MDPNANLKEQRALVKSLLQEADEGQPFDEIDVDRLCELVQSLDLWLMTGGFLPEDWQPRKTDPMYDEDGEPITR